MRIQGTITGFIFMKVFMGFYVKDMIKNVFKPTICTFLMGGVAFSLKQISNSIGWSFLSIFLCIIVYMILLILIARGDFKQILCFFKINKITKR